MKRIQATSPYANHILKRGGRGLSLHNTHNTLAHSQLSLLLLNFILLESGRGRMVYICLWKV